MDWPVVFFVKATFSTLEKTVAIGGRRSVHGMVLLFLMMIMTITAPTAGVHVESCTAIESGASFLSIEVQDVLLLGKGMRDQAPTLGHVFFLTVSEEEQDLKDCFAKDDGRIESANTLGRFYCL